MYTPKQLPYLAARTGVSFDRAGVLWGESVEKAAKVTGQTSGSEFWGAAEALVIEALEAERKISPLPCVLPLVRTQHQLGRLPLLALETLSRALWGRHTHAA